MVTGDLSGIPTGRGEELKAKESYEEGRLELWQLETGDVVQVTATDRGGSYRYEFTIRSADVEPLVVVTQINPDGSTVSSGDYEFRLRGSSRPVGREWPLWKYNPDRHDGKQYMIDYGGLNLGGEIVLLDRELLYGNNMARLQPAISTIEVVKYQDTITDEGLTEELTSVTVTE